MYVLRIIWIKGKFIKNDFIWNEMNEIVHFLSWVVRYSGDWLIPVLLSNDCFPNIYILKPQLKDADDDKKSTSSVSSASSFDTSSDSDTE